MSNRLLRPLYALLGPLVLLLTGCTDAVRPSNTQPAPTEHAMLEGFKQACTWPNPDVRSVGTLIDLFLASELDADAFDYFEARRADATGPSQAWFTAAAGLFQVRLAPTVPLLRRVAWVRDGMRKLDAGVDAAEGLPTYLRGAAFASLPPRFDAHERAVQDLEWVLDRAAQFPPGIERGAWQFLAAAHRQAGRDAEADAALRRAGFDPAASGALVRATPFSVSAADGFRFARPRLRSVADGVWYAAGFDFGAMAFVDTGDGVVAIDAGTHAHNARAAIDALRAFTRAPITHVILTHAHWDHIGGLDAFDQPGIEVIAQHRFGEQLAIAQDVDLTFSWFFSDRPIDLDVAPTRSIERTTSLTIGDRTFELIPVDGGETVDGLLVHVVDADVIFVGDVFMPYLGAPFVEEGEPRDLLTAIAEIEKRLPAQLIHGHQPLTDNWSAETMPGLRAAIATLLEVTDAARAAGEGHQTLIARNVMPASLRASPAAAVPYLVMRDQIIRRVYDRATGYWQPDGADLEVTTHDDLARALDALGADARDYARAAETLFDAGEAVMPRWLVQIGRHRFPADRRLAALERRILERLRVKNQTVDPFKFIVYSETLGDELPGWDADAPWTPPPTVDAGER